MKANLETLKVSSSRPRVKENPNLASMEDDYDQHSGARIGSNEDLLTEVLIRLQITSILRFKSVCKHWRLLLSDRHFTHRYDNYNFSKSRGLLAGDIYVPFDVDNRTPPLFRSFDFYFNRSDVKIKQSCNGLLLCSAYHNGAFEYYVFNPTTKQLAIIPSLPQNIRSMALAYHQTHCVHYKVVCVCILNPARQVFQIQIYSSDTGKWKTCVESLSGNPSFDQPVYWNGAVHWAPSYGDFMYFKLDVEQLQTLSVQEGLMSNRYFGESNGHLHLVSLTYREENGLTVYEMLMDRSGWFVKYRVQLDECLGAFPERVNQYNFSVADVVRGKEEEHTFLVLDLLVTPMKMIRYNVHDKSFKELYIHNNYTLKLHNFHRYIEILSSF